MNLADRDVSIADESKIDISAHFGHDARGMPARIEPFYAEVGRRLHDLRQGAGLTQEALGALLSPPMTRASIANIETGKQRVLAKTLVDLAEVLGVPITDLIPERAPRPAPPLKKESQRLREELASKLNLPRERLDQVISKVEGLPRS